MRVLRIFAAAVTGLVIGTSLILFGWKGALMCALCGMAWGIYAMADTRLDIEGIFLEWFEKHGREVLKNEKH